MVNAASITEIKMELQYGLPLEYTNIGNIEFYDASAGAWLPSACTDAALAATATYDGSEVTLDLIPCIPIPLADIASGDSIRFNGQFRVREAMDSIVCTDRFRNYSFRSRFFVKDANDATLRTCKDLQTVEYEIGNYPAAANTVAEFTTGCQADITVTLYDDNCPQNLDEFGQEYRPQYYLDSFSIYIPGGNLGFVSGTAQLIGYDHAGFDSLNVSSFVNLTGGSGDTRITLVNDGTWPLVEYPNSATIFKLDLTPKFSQLL